MIFPENKFQHADYSINKLYVPINYTVQPSDYSRWPHEKAPLSIVKARLSISGKYFLSKYGMDRWKPTAITSSAGLTWAMEVC